MGDMLTKTYYDNTVLDWLIALALIAGVYVATKITLWVFSNVLKKLSSRTKSKLDDLLIENLQTPVVVALTTLGIRFAVETLTLPEKLAGALANGTQFVVVMAIAFGVSRLLDALYESYLVPLADKSESHLDDQVLPILRRITRFIVLSLGLVIALNNAGYDVAALLAGLGIGGLALAMAAKDTVSNVFGGFTIFTDKPFSIGDRIEVDGFDGTITEVGLRSTRLKTLAGRIVTIPNARFSDAPVENISSEPTRKVVLNLGLTYDTTPENMQLAMDTLKEITEAHDSLDDNTIIAFNGFGDFAMNILLIYYIKSGEDILGTQTDINLAILEQFNDKGLEFAFPTQTLYTIKQDS